VPVAPVTILGSEKLMPKGSALIHSGTVRLVFHQPLIPSQFNDKEDLIAATRREVASALAPALRETNLDPAS
jgi:hypothetical protein